MPSTSANLERNESDSHAYPGRFILLMVLLAFATVLLQVALVVITSEILMSSGQIAIPARVRQNANSLLTNSAAVWQGELWVSVSTGPLPYPRMAAVKMPQSRLFALDLKNGTARETSISLSPAPRGIVVIKDQLWCVSNSVVHQIIDQQAIPRNPRRFLNQPSNPFAYDGVLAVIDHTSNGDYVLLTWRDNEWLEVGKLDVPKSAAASPWSTPDLRVVPTSNSIFLFYSEGSAVIFREGISLIPALNPVVAREPVDEKESEAAAAKIKFNNWVSIPAVSNWMTAWEALAINDVIRIYSNSSTNAANPVQQFELRGQNWVHTTPSFPPEAVSFSAAPGTPGYLVTDDLRLFELNGSTFQRVTKGVPISERFRSVLQYFELYLCYVFVTGLLVFVTGRLMHRYRNPQYLYGKRTVTQAPIGRRAIARGIDSLITVFPAYFWFSTIWQSQMLIQQQSVIPGFQVPILWMIFATFGMWLGGLVAISFMQGLFGFTPGKWICGIRTLRTTLRPCGLLRSLARELVVYADSLFFLTWLPGVLLIAFTPHWQRLGDLTADTVVVLDPKPRSNDVVVTE